jgi:hypothetical protein
MMRMFLESNALNKQKQQLRQDGLSDQLGSPEGRIGKSVGAAKRRRNISPRVM